MDILRRILGPKERNLKVGGLYSIENGKGSYSIAKVLALEPGIVHVRLYREKFAERPISVDPASLSLGSMLDGDFGIGHTPLAVAQFTSWHPSFLLQTHVTDDEILGYKFWKSRDD